MNKHVLYLVISTMGFCLFTSILPSCGFFNLENFIGSLDSSGDTPHLSLRGSENKTDLYDRDCKGNSRCEDTCEEIYEKSKSYTDCYDLSIGTVADLDDLFHILIEADEEELDDIDSDIFEEYLENGVDGFTDKVIEKLKDDKEKDKIENIFNWMIENEAVADVLNEEDDNNKVLKELLVARCEIKDCIVNITTPSIIDITDKCARGESNLFFALLNNYNVENFFLKAANGNNIELFSLGHEILAEIMSNNNRTLEEECIRDFYCRSEDSDNNTLADFFLNENVQQYIGTIDTYRDGNDDTLSCRSEDFSELLPQ